MNGRCLLILVLFLFAARPAQSGPLRIGVAQIDVTPEYPIRLNGFAKRKSESDGVLGRIWVKAIAFVDDGEGPAILITADNLGVPASIVAELERRLAGAIGLKPGRLTVTATHTHSAPMLRGVANAIFGHDLTPAEWDHINRYTAEFTDALERVAIEAARAHEPAFLEFASGTAAFAMNRRTKGGPVDHDLPVLVVRSAKDGKPRAIWFSYACHCVVLAERKIHGDWAGSAMEAIQADFPGVIALASIGCGADQNPVSRDKVEIADQFGRQIADEVKRLVASAVPSSAPADGHAPKPVKIVTSPIMRQVETALDFEPRSRAEWLELMKKGGQHAYYARLNLARIDHGEELPKQLKYPLQAWAFGDQLALLFLPGEVVVDYALRIKREFHNVIPVAYANDAPGYIPSERILQEGGYEGGGAMIYYDRPNRFAAGLEQKIIDGVRSLLGGFRR